MSNDKHVAQRGKSAGQLVRCDAKNWCTLNSKHYTGEKLEETREWVERTTGKTTHLKDITPDDVSNFDDMAEFNLTATERAARREKEVKALRSPNERADFDKEMRESKRLREIPKVLSKFPHKTVLAAHKAINLGKDNNYPMARMTVRDVERFIERENIKKEFDRKKVQLSKDVAEMKAKHSETKRIPTQREREIPQALSEFPHKLVTETHTWLQTKNGPNYPMSRMTKDDVREYSAEFGFNPPEVKDEDKVSFKDFFKNVW